MEKPAHIEHDIENKSFHAYYGPEHRQSYDFMMIADRNKLLPCEVFDLCKTAGLSFTEMNTWWGIRFPDGTGFVVTKMDLEHSRETLAERAAKEKGKL